MDFFKDILNYSTKEPEDDCASSNLQRVLNKKFESSHAQNKPFLFDGTDNASSNEVNIMSFQPATGLKEDQRNRKVITSGFRSSQTALNIDIADSNEMTLFGSSGNLVIEEAPIVQDAPFRMQRTLSCVRFDEKKSTKVIQIRDEQGNLTHEFKKVLHRLVQKRLVEELSAFKDRRNETEDVSETLIKGALDYVNEVKDKELQVVGALSMIPEEYEVSAEKADFGRSESDILNFEIERMRGMSMRIGTAQSSRKETKDTKVTSEQENMVRKTVEVGFLLNEPEVTLTIARFIDHDHSIAQFRRLGQRQRSKETGRVLLNKLFSQPYDFHLMNAIPEYESDNSEITSSSVS